MTLPLTNLTFSALQTEFGGSNPISLSEYYRGGLYVPSGTTSAYGTIPTSGQISFGVFRGTQSILDTQTVTVGNFDDGLTVSLWGYVSTLGTGSISDGTSNIYSGASIAFIYWVTDGSQPPFPYQAVQFGIDGIYSNSGWTTMTINGTNFNRTSAIFTQTGTQTYWAWSTSTNVFGTTPGATRTVTWI